MKRDYVSEIQAIRSRTRAGSANTELQIRLGSLQVAFKERATLKAGLSELLKYFPVALVALMEGYFRARIKELLDHNESYLTNLAAENSQLRFDFQLVKAIQGKAITLGDVLAHLLPINDLATLNSSVSKLLGFDFLAKLREVHDRFETEINKKPKVPIIDDPEQVFKQVELTFQTRHIICHELASGAALTLDETELLFTSCVTFVRAADEYFDQLEHPDAPLTQSEITQMAGDNLRKSQAELKRVLEEVRKLLPPERIKELNEFQKIWLQYCETAATYSITPFQGGTICGTIYAGKSQELTELRTDEFRKYLSSLSKGYDFF